MKADLDRLFLAGDEIEIPDTWAEITAREPRPEQSPPFARRMIIAAFALLVAAGAIAFAVRAFTAPIAPSSPSSPLIAPRSDGEILFIQGSTENSSIDAIQPDGSEQQGVLPAHTYYRDWTWSPDGTQIAYVGIVQYSQQSADGQVHFGIYTSNPDGSDARLLTEGLNVGWPSWSPDGTQIAFSSTASDPNVVKNCEPGGDGSCPTDIYIMNADGSNITRLTSDPAPEFEPEWSPDGSRIAFVRASGDVAEIDSVNTDGTGLVTIATGTGGNQGRFSWSPDGTQIAFVEITRPSWDIAVVNADGTGRRTIFSRDGVWNEGPVWSPDGTKIAFSSTLGAYPPGCGMDSDVCSDLFVMSPDGSHLTRLTTAAHGVGEISWQPATSTASTTAAHAPPLSLSITGAIHASDRRPRARA